MPLGGGDYSCQLSPFSSQQNWDRQRENVGWAWPTINRLHTAMKLCHHDLQIEIDDTWWAEAGMEGFIPHNKAYHVDRGIFKDQEPFEIRIDEIKPVMRNPGVAYFVKDRIIKVLKGFRNHDEIPPVEVIIEPPDSKFRYNLINGTHRLYCSLAAGFSHVPAVKVSRLTNEE